MPIVSVAAAGHPHLHRRPPRLPPTGVLACTAGLLCRRFWASTSSPPAASSAADWCPRLHGWPIMTPLLGVYVCTVGLLCRCRLVFPSARPMPPLMGVYVFTDRLAFAAADWCLCLHGSPIMPPLLGVYDSTAGLPASPPTDVLAYTVGWSHHRC
uniref:HGWP repeat containing protein-like n=1 Tax=Oryza sativa subsp. japonica TaxID=39947 RepID=Q6Z1M2_ORYSJ|nr:HGWP repeat containing protein-like [Oryza sativa Japonica Group]